MEAKKEETKPEVKAEAKVEGKEEQKKRAPKAPKKPAAKKEEVPEMSQLDIRVGKIVKVDKHPESVKLYNEEVDMGKGEIRKIASGLQEFVPIAQLMNRMVVVLCNLKEKKMAGYPSHGMILCANSADSKTCEVLDAPAGSQPGDCVVVEGFERKPAADLNLSKKNNPWVKVQPQLTTGADHVVSYNGKPLKTDKGAVTCKTVVAARIS